MLNMEKSAFSAPPRDVSCSSIGVENLLKIQRLIDESVFNFHNDDGITVLIAGAYEDNIVRTKRLPLK